MKKTQALIGDAGVTFSNAVSAQSRCKDLVYWIWSNITSFSSPVLFSSLPPLCAVPAAAASSRGNIHTIIWSEITPSLATAAARCGRRRPSPSPFHFTSIRCATRPSTAGNTWIRSAFDPFAALYTITGLLAGCSFFQICLQWYQKLCTTRLNICNL